MEAIKISDLSIGDWVKCNGFKATIAGYNAESGSIQVLTKQKNKMWFGIEDIEPIPLTPEILEKNGFDKNNEYLYTIALENDITLGVRTQSDGYLFELKREKRRIGELLGIFRGIYNVHQLQHALRLAGVEKDIEI